MQGTVKWFNDDKGYGFITPNEGNSDIYVHFTGISGKGHRTLTEGQEVTFDTEATDRGPKAVNVKVIN